MTSWKKSASSGGVNCVEIARLSTERIGVRDSKIGDAGPILSFGMEVWAAFNADVRANVYELSRGRDRA